MWKEKLPANCPPAKAKEANIEVFRILKKETPSEEDFIPYARIYFDNPRYQSLCAAYAISFFDSLENAKKAWKEALKRGNNIGSYIGQFTVLESDGTNYYNSKTGHYNTWFYSSWQIQKFNPSFVLVLNEN